MIEDKAINIIDMNLKYSQLVSFLLEASQNKADFMQSYLLPFGHTTNVKRDVVLDELLKPHAVDDTVEIILKVTLPAITKVCQHLFTDHLQGGKYADIDMAGRNVLAGTPKHNKFSESVFGFVDHLVRAKPNICTFSTEAYVMFAQQQDWCLASREGCEHPGGNPQGSQSRCEESESVIRETAGRDCHRPKSEGAGSLEESRRAEGQEAAATRAVYQ